MIAKASLLVVIRWDAWHEICQAKASHITRGLVWYELLSPDKSHVIQSQSMTMFWSHGFTTHYDEFSDWESHCDILLYECECMWKCSHVSRRYRVQFPCGSYNFFLRIDFTFLSCFFFPNTNRFRWKWKKNECRIYFLVALTGFVIG